MWKLRSLLQAVHAEGFEKASVAKGVCKCFAEKSCQVSGQSVSCKIRDLYCVTRSGTQSAMLKVGIAAAIWVAKARCEVGAMCVPCRGVAAGELLVCECWSSRGIGQLWLGGILVPDRSRTKNALAKRQLMFSLMCHRAHPRKFSAVGSKKGSFGDNLYLLCS